MSSTTATLRAEDLEFFADSLDLARLASTYEKYGAVVVRGLSRDYVPSVLRDIEEILAQSTALLPQAKKSDVHAGTLTTPDGSHFNEDPLHPGRIIINSLRFNALISAAFLQSLLNPKLLEILRSVLGTDIELWKWGQCVYRQPDSGVPKSMHQDEYYFEHRHHTSTAVLTYAVDTNMENSPLYVLPGSHTRGVIEHEDDRWTGSALGDQGLWDEAIPLTGKAGDSIIFNGLTIHGSPANRSTQPRPVFIQRYRRADDFCVIDAGNVRDRKRQEQNPVTSKPTSDWGLMVSGLRRFTAQ